MGHTRAFLYNCSSSITIAIVWPHFGHGLAGSIQPNVGSLKKKKMRFTHHDKRITLIGIKKCTSKCLPLKAIKFRGLVMKGGIAQLVQLTLASPSVSAAALPEDIQELIQQHGNLVQEPKTLPPHRQGDHSIPLLEGSNLSTSNHIDTIQCKRMRLKDR